MESAEDVADWFLERVEQIAQARFERALDPTTFSVVVHPDTKYQIMCAAKKPDVHSDEMVEAMRHDMWHDIDTPWARVRVHANLYSMPPGAIRPKVEPNRVREILDEYVVAPYLSPMDRRFTIREPRLQGPAQYA